MSLPGRGRYITCMSFAPPIAREWSRHLNEAGIGTGIHYPVPLHLQKAYAGLGYMPEDFPVSARVAKEILSLPMFPQLTAAQLATVASQIRSFTDGNYASAGKGAGGVVRWLLRRTRESCGDLPSSFPESISRKMLQGNWRQPRANSFPNRIS